MKNKIIIGAVLFVLSLASSTAQDAASVNASVTKSFEKAFQGATKVRWSACPKKISLAQFAFMGKPWLAYYDHDGKLLTSGRRITLHELPVRVQSGMLNQKQSFENKYGAVTIANIYEMITGSVTEYYVLLVNHKIRLMIAVRTDGSVVIKSKKKLPISPKAPADVLARQK